MNTTSIEPTVYVYAVRLLDGSIYCSESCEPGLVIARIFSGLEQLWSPPYKVLGVKEKTANCTAEIVNARHRASASTKVDAEVKQVKRELVAA